MPFNNKQNKIKKWGGENQSSAYNLYLKNKQTKIFNLDEQHWKKFGVLIKNINIL
jgi:hypothetical protein